MILIYIMNFISSNISTQENFVNLILLIFKFNIYSLHEMINLTFDNNNNNYYIKYYIDNNNNNLY